MLGSLRTQSSALRRVLVNPSSSPVRAFSVSRVATKGPDSSADYGSSHVATDAKIIEEEKAKNLSGKQKSSLHDAPGWNEKLASHSEAAVKAERSAENHSIDDLQRIAAEEMAKEAGADTLKIHQEIDTTIKKT